MYCYVHVLVERVIMQKSGAERRMLLAFWLIFSFMLVEVAGGWWSGSLALMADAGHMVTDAAALGLAYLAFRLGRKAADARRTFGYLRLEVVAGFVNALALFGLVAWIVYEAWQRLQAPIEILSGPMLAVAVVGLLVNLLVLRILTHGHEGHDHVNVQGAVLHVLGDLLGSVGAVVAALVIRYTGWTPIDPILSVVVSLLIMNSAGRLLQRSLHILLEGAPPQLTPEAIEAHLQARVPGVAQVHHVHVWSITSGRVLATLHVRPKDFSQAREVIRQVEHELTQHLGVEHATVALDWEGDAAFRSLEQPQPLQMDVHGHNHHPHNHHHHDHAH